MGRDKSSLLEKALATKSKSFTLPTDEEVDLLVAFLDGRINQTQVAHAMGFRVPGEVNRLYPKLLSWVVHLWRAGRIKAVEG